MENNLQVDQFNQIKADSLKIIEEVKDLTINGVDDKKGYEAVRAGKMKLVKQRTFIETERKKITSVFDGWKKQVMDMKDELLKVMEPTEKILAERQAEIDRQKELITRRGNLPAKIEKLKEIELSIADDFLLTLSEAQFDSFFNEKKSEYLLKKEQELKEAQETQRQKELEVERERQKLIEIETARKEAEEQAKRQAEIDKINAEKEKEIALKKAEEEKQIAIEAERRKADAEKQKIIDEQNRLEDARIAEETARKEAEAAKARLEVEETKKRERQKKVINFLKENGCTEENKDDYKLEWQGQKAVLWKKVAEDTF